MTTITISAAQGCAPTLALGKRGENLATEVRFDFSSWAEEFGAPGAVELYVRRCGETTAYPVVLTIDGSEAVWPVSSIDTHIVGLGEAEYVYLIDETVVKTALYGTAVEPDIGQPASEPPEPYESWMEELGEMAAGTLINAQRAEAAQTAAETAKGKAEDAQEAAETAQGKAEDAQEAAEAAQTAAETAQGLAEAAQTAAETAQGKAEAAQDAAEGAQGLAERAQAFAEAAQGAAAGSAAAAARSAAAAHDDAERAEQAAGTSGYLEIEIDADGHLIYTRTDAVDVDFELVDGHLIMEAI